MKIYKITEASEYLGVSINTLKTFANNGNIKSFNVDKFTGYKYKPFLAEYKDGILKSSLNGLVLTKSEDQDRYLLYIGEEEGRGTITGDMYSFKKLFKRGDIVKSSQLTVLVTKDMITKLDSRLFEGTVIDGPKEDIGQHSTEWFYSAFNLTKISIWE